MNLFIILIILIFVYFLIYKFNFNEGFTNPENIKKITLKTTINGKLYYLGISDIKNCINYDNNYEGCSKYNVILYETKNKYTTMNLQKIGDKYILFNDYNKKLVLTHKMRDINFDCLCFENLSDLTNAYFTMVSNNLNHNNIIFNNKYLGLCIGPFSKCNQSNNLYHTLCLYTDKLKSIYFEIEEELEKKCILYKYNTK